MKKTETLLKELSKLERHFLDLEEKAIDLDVRRYYSGIVNGLKKAQDLAMDEVPYTYIRDN